MELDKIYRAVLESMREEVYVRDLDMNLLYVNPAAEKLTGWPLADAVGKKCWEVFGDERQLCRRVCPVNHAISQRLHILHHEGNVKTRNGEIKNMKVSISPYHEEDTVRGAVIVMEDITRLKAVEATHVKTLIALQESQQRLKSAARLAYDMLYEWTVADDVLHWYGELDNILGYKKAEIPETIEEWLRLIHPEDKARIRREIERHRTETAPYTYNYRIMHKNGSWRHWEDRALPVFDEQGVPVRWLGVCTDITQRAQSEKALEASRKKLQTLYFRLVHAQERERKRIALELHDDFGQMLILLKLQLNSMRCKLKIADKGLDEECGVIMDSVQQLIEKTRDLFHGLTPLTLHDMGFGNALEHLVQAFTSHSDMKISMEMDDIEKVLSTKAKIFIYRIFQEILSNIQRHAAADFVSIAVKKNETRIYFTIKDNGKGFQNSARASAASHTAGLGLTAMDERVQMLGGNFEIKSQLNKGTRITFSIPVECTSLSEAN